VGLRECGRQCSSRRVRTCSGVPHGDVQLLLLLLLLVLLLLLLLLLLSLLLLLLLSAELCSAACAVPPYEGRLLVVASE